MEVEINVGFAEIIGSIFCHNADGGDPSFLLAIVIIFMIIIDLFIILIRDHVSHKYKEAVVDIGFIVKLLEGTIAVIIWLSIRL